MPASMRINIKEVKIYLISPCTGKYRDRVRTVVDRLMDQGFKRIEIVRSVEDSVGINSLNRTDIMIMDWEKGGSEPFIILEDDCGFYNLRDGYEWIDVPDDADAVYLGVANWIYPYGVDSLYGRRGHIIENTPAYLVDNGGDTVQIKGMTSTHAVMYFNRAYTNKFAEVMGTLLSYQTSLDLVFAALQPAHKVYALKKPVFYQDNALGGQEIVTKLNYNGSRYEFYAGR